MNEKKGEEKMKELAKFRKHVKKQTKKVRNVWKRNEHKKDKAE